MDLDDALQQVGDFGRFQALNFALLCLPVAHSAIYMLSYVFTARDFPHRCFVPECDVEGQSILNPPWTAIAVPIDSFGNAERCLRFAPKPDQDPNGVCNSLKFTNRTVPCDKFVFPPGENTIASEFNITCEENKWKLTIVGSMNILGQVLGMPMVGFMSDRFGRRGMLLGALVTSGVLGIARSFAPSYSVFLILEFADAFCAAGIYSACFILGLELVGGKQRVFGGSLVGSFYSLGCGILGFVAWFERDWRRLLRLAYAPIVISSICVWVLPESVRWLVSRGRVEKAQTVLTRAARVNRVTLEAPICLRPTSDKTFGRRLSAVHGRSGRRPSAACAHAIIPGSPTSLSRPSTPGLREESVQGSPVLDPSRPQSRNAASRPSRVSLPISIASTARRWPLLQVCGSRRLMIRLLITSVLWVTNSFVYFGLALRSVSLAGDLYLNFVLAAAAEVPAYVFTWAASERYGRRWIQSSTLAVTGVSLLAFLIVPSGLVWVQLSLYMTGKLAITASFTILYVFTAELFPTNARHSLLGLCSTVGRLGSTLAPQTPLLEVFYWGLPILLFGAMSLNAALLTLLLPETLDKELPDNVTQAEAVGRKDKEQKSTS